mgnify:FL=1|jgi:lycopene beta-cyclase
MAKLDVTIVGGGLAGGLIALALNSARPDIRFKLVESGPSLGGEHTWSFHDTDLDSAGHALVEPLVTYRWSGQQVAFPAHSRRLSTGYNSISSEKFHSALIERLGDNVELKRAVAMVSPEAAGFQDGEEIRASAVIDCRGEKANEHLVLGFQKFLGRVVRLKEPHGLECPIIMDASVPQLDGYRFIYVLPFDNSTLLIEDTRYADGPRFSDSDLRDEISRYANKKGWSIETVIREERGVLPIALAGDIEAYWGAQATDAAGAVPRAGMRAGLFHPLTGYSLPDAVALALKIASASDLSAPALYELTKSYSIGMWRKRAFYRLLTRMLFRAAAPEARYQVLERFYKLPQGLIERFYAGNSTASDKLRVLAGKPPVPILKALRVLREASVMSSDNQKADS